MTTQNSALKRGPQRIVVAGATSSTRLTLEALLRHGAPVVGVLQLRPESSHLVTGFEALDKIAEPAGVDCLTFRNINDATVLARVREWQPDLLFVVGLSQLVGAELLQVPTLGSVGFHPTFLPAGRGRAPLAWLVLDNTPGAANFFLMDEGTDSGPLFVQEPFTVTAEDYAGDVGAKLDTATVRALDRWIPRLLAGEWNPQPQDEILATYNGRRSPEDGLIDWNNSALQTHSLIRASADPHPGAYTWLSDRKLLVWKAHLETKLPWRGVAGRVLLICPERGALVQAGDGLLWLTEVQFADQPAPQHPSEVLKVGQKLGMVLQDEVASLKSRLSQLEKRLDSLEASRE